MNRGLKVTALAGSALLLAAGMQITSHAAGWKLEAGVWHYYLSDGTMDTDCFRRSGNDFFYLDENGDMAVNRLVEYNGNYYYVNSSGARVSNEWRKIENDDYYDYYDDYASNYAWYYFRADGRACKAPDSGKTVFVSLPVASGAVNQYAFDEHGRMLYGWVDENSTRQTGDDAWRTGVYYCGGPEDGARVSGEWRELEVYDDEVADDFGKCWFYFLSSGRKLTDTSRVIDNRRYLFEADGNAHFLWYDDTAAASGSDAVHSYYNTSDQCWLATGWFKTVPPEEIDADAYSAGEEYWFYGLSRGGVVTSQIRYIDGHRYGFNEKGEMLHGLYLMDVDDDGAEILSYRKLEDPWALPGADAAGEVYYFGDMPKEGVMATGKTTVELEGIRFSYRFKTSGSDRGTGVTGIFDSYIYVKGCQIKPEEGMRYSIIVYDGSSYLVNSSGKIQKNRKNLRDADGCYYSSDSKGIVTYQGYDKQA